VVPPRMGSWLEQRIPSTRLGSAPGLVPAEWLEAAAGLVAPTRLLASAERLVSPRMGSWLEQRISSARLGSATGLGAAE
jgi:hypothetical protein